jgi:hypothetical protein
LDDSQSERRASRGHPRVIRHDGLDIGFQMTRRRQMDGVERPQLGRQQDTRRREQLVVHANEIQPSAM